MSKALPGATDPNGRTFASSPFVRGVQTVRFGLVRCAVSALGLPHREQAAGNSHEGQEPPSLLGSTDL
jgi:hypothetical protein